MIPTVGRTVHFIIEKRPFAAIITDVKEKTWGELRPAAPEHGYDICIYKLPSIHKDGKLIPSPEFTSLPPEHPDAQGKWAWPPRV